MVHRNRSLTALFNTHHDINSLELLLRNVLDFWFTNLQVAVVPLILRGLSCTMYWSREYSLWMLPEFWWGQSDWRILKIFHSTHMISTYFTENKNILRSCRQIVLTAQNRFLQITDIVVQWYSHINCIPCDICYDVIFLNSFMPWKPVSGHSRPLLTLRNILDCSFKILFCRC